MARYGREFEGGARGPDEWGRPGPGYGTEYGRVGGYTASGVGRRYGRRRRPRREVEVYAPRERPGYSRTTGYGAGWSYGEASGLGYGEEFGAARHEVGYGIGYGEEYAPGYASSRGMRYGSEYGRRGRPYRGGYEAWYRGRARRRGREDVPYYGWEPGAYYGRDYMTRRSSPYGRGRRARGFREGWAYGGENRRTYPYSEGEFGYEGDFGASYRGRRISQGYEAERTGRGYEEAMMRTEEEREGWTPPDRWPGTGHDVDERPEHELRMSDGEIREAVLENLFQDSWVDPSRVEVEVNDGVVTLTGEVRDFMEARYVSDDAWESPGVRGVINNLTVRTDRPQDKMELPQTAGSRKGRGGRR